MNKKYELDECKHLEDVTLYRIRALRDFGDVKAGELGGFIEKEDNLSHDGDCWIYDNARVYGKAWVCDNALIYDNARICDNAVVCDNAYVYGDAVVCDNAKVYGNARVYDKAWVYDKARIYGDAVVCDNAWVCDKAMVYDNAKICNAYVYGKARVCGNAYVYGKAVICGDARISDFGDILNISYLGSDGRSITVFRTDSGVSVSCGYFSGTLAEFEDRVNASDTENRKKFTKEYRLLIELIKVHFEVNKEGE